MVPRKIICNPELRPEFPDFCPTTPGIATSSILVPNSHPRFSAALMTIKSKYLKLKLLPGSGFLQIQFPKKTYNFYNF